MSPAAGPAGTAVVVGHRGQDGRLLSDLLRAGGTRVVGVGRPDGRPPGPDEAAVDVGDPESVAALVADVRPDEVYYLAAHHASSEAMAAGGTADDLRASWRVNVAGPAVLLDAVRAHHPEARVLLASSCLVHPAGPERIDERSPLGPDTLYGVTKAAALLQARAARAAGALVWTAVLFPHESGLRPPSFVASRIVRSALAVAAGDAEVVTVADPGAVVDWSLAARVVEGLVGMVRATEPGDYVVASGEGRTVAELAAAVLGHLGLDPDRHLRVEPGLLARPSARRVGDPSRLAAALGWTGRPGLDEFAAALVAEHRDALAEGGGFEPPRAVKPNTDSSRAP